MKILKESREKTRAANQARVHQQRDEFIENYEQFRKKYRTMMASVDVMYDERLTPQARLLFLIISGLSFKLGYCFATNEGLSKRLCLGLTSVKKYLIELQEQNLITTNRYQLAGAYRRRIFIDFDELKERYKPMVSTAEDQQSN
jgi:hypothetical protein